MSFVMTSPMRNTSVVYGYHGALFVQFIDFKVAVVSETKSAVCYLLQ